MGLLTHVSLEIKPVDKYFLIKRFSRKLPAICNILSLCSILRKTNGCIILMNLYVYVAIGFLFLVPLATSSKAMAETFSTTQKVERRIETEFLLSAGYRVDEYDWNIAGPTRLGNYVNVLSELTWDTVEIYQIKLSNKTLINKIVCLKGTLGYGSIFDGSNQDSDFLGNNRTLEYSRSNNRTVNDEVWDASVGIGYQVNLIHDHLSVTPLIGYSYHKQNLAITDGNRTITSIYTPPAGPIIGLDSTYDAEWMGPWVGLDVHYKFKKRHTVFAEVEYHWADYNAEANWNLRSDLAHPVSFEHAADGNGIVLSMGWNFFLNDRWVLNMTCYYQKWSTGAGSDKVFFLNGNTLETPLNEANWKSRAIMFGIAYHF
jgi:hypothetical protein